MDTEIRILTGQRDGTGGKRHRYIDRSRDKEQMDNEIYIHRQIKHDETGGNINTATKQARWNERT